MINILPRTIKIKNVCDFFPFFFSKNKNQSLYDLYFLTYTYFQSEHLVLIVLCGNWQYSCLYFTTSLSLGSMVVNSSGTMFMRCTSIAFLSNSVSCPHLISLSQCTMCILGATMALWSKAEIQKYTF